jgi:flagellar hook capping protein FlgD
MRTQRIALLAVIAGVGLTGSLFIALRASCGKTDAQEHDGRHNPSSAPKAPAQTEVAPIQVLVTKLTPQPGRVEYHYTVTNGSAFPVHTLLVGWDEFYGGPTLAAYPTGWDGDTIPSTSYQAPPGWKFEVQPMEEESLITVKWVRTQQGKAIMGGESAGGFTVVVPQADPTYESGGLWTTYMMGEESFWGAIQSSGVTSVPVSSIFARSNLKVSPNPAGGTVAIQFAMPATGKVTVDIFDVAGRRVRRVVDEQRTVGISSASWDGKNDSGKAVGSGVYFVRVKTPSTQRFARITWLPGNK